MAATAVSMSLFAFTSAAHAGDEGGVANPATACPNGYTVKAADIHDFRGFRIGRVDLRWAYSCGGNWARTTSYVGSVSQVESRVAMGDWLSGPGSAFSYDYNTAQNWTYYISIRPDAPACAKGRLFYQGYWHEATVCSAK
ncbi:hypothetical protein [Amycolatopsis coloradensis]|nr:hypothetical protein [Amycolatopsis coloradensis]